MDTRLTQIAGYTFVTNPRDVYIGKSLEVYGEYSHGEVLLLRQLLRPRHNIVEVGANIGSHTVFLAKEACPQGIVYAFEPRRITFQLLCANVAVNGLANVHAFQEGLGREPEVRAEGPLPIDRAKANFGGISIGDLPGEGERLVIRTLDDYLEVFSPIALIKADVEGWEQDVLLGGQKLIARDRPILYVENHYQDFSEALIQTIIDMDYDLWWHLPYMFRRDNRAGNDFNIFGRIRSKNMLCIPRERDIKVDGLPKVESPTDRPGGGDATKGA